VCVGCGARRSGVTLDVVAAFDPRLPALSREDMTEVIAEARRIIAAKLGGEVPIAFRLRGTVTLEELFADTRYRSSDLYRELSPYKYDVALGAAMPLLQDDAYRRAALRFLETQWDLASLRAFFPGKTVRSHEDALDELLRVYHAKVQWLLSRKTPGGEALLRVPFAPWQSYVEWLGYMNEQDDYDVIFTNGLIVLDLLTSLYPHSVCKHAKVGGSSFASPKREALDGMTLMVSTLEEYGGVDGISRTAGETSAEMRDRILGGFVLAHEFGHAFYLIPDVYDHGDTCLMNSSFENLSFEEGYRLLVSDLSPCPKCRPWIDAKRYVVEAKRALARGEYKAAGDLFRKAEEATPEKIDGERAAYREKLLRAADEADRKGGGAGP
jgi:hypothetical protein